MIDDMGILRTTVQIAPWPEHDHRMTFTEVMVDTGSEYSWFPEATLTEMGIVPVRSDRFQTADGRVIERFVGFAVMYVAG